MMILLCCLIMVIFLDFVCILVPISVVTILLLQRQYLDGTMDNVMQWIMVMHDDMNSLVDAVEIVVLVYLHHNDHISNV